MTQFYISIEDDLFRHYVNGNLTKLFESYDSSWGNAPLQSSVLTARLNQCQKDIEQRNFDVRKNLLKYDDVMNVQRGLIYKQRSEIRTMDDEKILALLHEFIHHFVEKKYMQKYLPEDSYPEEWNLQGLVDDFTSTYEFPEILTLEDIKDKNRQEVESFLLNRLDSVIQYKQEVLPPSIFYGFLKQIFLQLLDEEWEDHINRMSMLQQGVFLHAYGQQDPLVVFKEEAHSMFEEMVERVKERYAYVAVAFWIEVRDA